MSDTVTAKQSLCKGTVLLSLLKYIFTQLNEEQKEKLISQLNEEYKNKILANRVLSTDKVPVSLLNQLTIMAAHIKGKPVKLFARDAGRFSAEEGMKSIYGIFSKILTPHAQVSKASLIWSNLYDKGKMETITVNKKKVIIKLVDIQTELVMCERIFGWLERTNQLSGIENVRVIHTKCCSFGNQHCEWEITWKKSAQASIVPHKFNT